MVLTKRGHHDYFSNWRTSITMLAIRDKDGLLVPYIRGRLLGTEFWMRRGPIRTDGYITYVALMDGVSPPHSVKLGER